MFLERTSVGLDVHARSVVACAIDGVTGEVRRLFEIGAFTEEFLICPTQADGIGKLRQ